MRRAQQTAMLQSAARSASMALASGMAAVACLPAGLLLPVKLEQVGGDDGDDETIATWTYTATTLDGTVLYDELDIIDDPEAPTYKEPHQWRRPSIGMVVPATFGLLYRTGPNVDEIDPWPRWGLLWCNEVPAVEAC